MKFRDYIAEATYKQDKEFRDKADKAYDDLMKYIKKVKIINLSEYRPEKGIIVQGKDIGYDDLLIIVNPGNSKAGGFGHHNIQGKKYKIISVYGTKNVFSQLTPKELKQTYIDRSTFVHEFIHYLDSKRVGKYDSGSKAYKEQGEKAYFNTNSEYNAFMQELQHTIDTAVSTMARIEHKKMLNDWLRDFKSFQKQVNSVANNDKNLKDFISLLSKSNKRKYLKRLYELYKGLYDQYYHLL